LTVKFYTLAEYCLFALFLSFYYNNLLIKKAIIFSIIPFTLYWTYDFKRNFSNYTIGPLLVEFLIFMIFIILFFYDRMHNDSVYPISLTISFWICVGLFIYFSGNFFYLIFSSYKKNNPFLLQIKYIYATVTITKNIILSLSFLGTEKKDEDEFPRFPAELNLDSTIPFKN
jgi:hypothetical protein